MLIIILNILSHLIALGPASLSIIVTIFLQMKIKRDGYKFIKKEGLYSFTIGSFIPIVGWFPFIYIFAPLFSDSDYKKYLNTLLEEKEIEPINPSKIERKVSSKKETKILPKKDKGINKNSRDTKVMIEIGYLLELIKQVDVNLYEKKTKEYRDMLLAGTKGLTLSKTSDYVFLEEFKISLEEILEKNKDNITLGSFQKIKLEYERHFQEQNSKTKLTFNDIENMAKKYLEEQKNYSPNIYNMIINYLSYFYLCELYENKDYLNIEELRNTEFERVFLYGVLKTIKELQSKGIIEDNLKIDMIEVPTLENVIKAIQEIKMANVDKPKTMILEK